MKPPLHLLLPLWGREHCGEFLALGARCLQWQDNLPRIAREREVVIQVYTSQADWAYLSEQPMFARWGRPLFFRPVVENTQRDRWTSRHQQMTIGHHLMMEAARAARAIAVPIFADSVFADGDLPRLLGLLPGPPRRLVMCIGFRASHESLMEDFSGQALSRRELVALGLKHLHSQMRCWSAAAPAYGSDILGGPQWWVGDSGLVTHSIYWEPCAIDFSHEWPCDCQPLLDWTIDGHWPWANVTRPEHYYAVTDSDEYFHLTTARETGPNAYHFEPEPMQGTLVEELRRARSLPCNDPLRQQLFVQQFLVHSNNIDWKLWKPVCDSARLAELGSRVPLNTPYAFASSSPWDADPLTELPVEQSPEQQIDDALALILARRVP